MSLCKRRRYDAASRWAESSGNKCSAKLGLKYVIAFLLAILLGSGQVMAKNAGWNHFRVVRNRTRWYFIPLPLNIVVLYFTSQIMFQPNFNTSRFTHSSRIFRRYSSLLFETVQSVSRSPDGRKQSYRSRHRCGPKSRNAMLPYTFFAARRVGYIRATNTHQLRDTES